jgi:hypothetical protein
MEKNPKLGNDAPHYGAPRLLDQVRSAIRHRHYSYCPVLSAVSASPRSIGFARDP